MVEFVSHHQPPFTWPFGHPDFNRPACCKKFGKTFKLNLLIDFKSIKYTIETIIKLQVKIHYVS